LLLNNNDVHGFISKGVILAKVIIKDCNINPLSWIFINIKCCFKIPFRVVIIFYCLWLCFLLSICQFYIRISFSKFALLFNILCFDDCEVNLSTLQFLFGFYFRRSCRRTQSNIKILFVLCWRCLFKFNLFNSLFIFILILWFDTIFLLSFCWFSINRFFTLVHYCLWGEFSRY